MRSPPRRQRWSRRLEPGVPALLCSGAPAQAWWPGADPLLFDGQRLWRFIGSSTLEVVQLPELEQVLERGQDHLQLILTDDRMYLLGPEHLEPISELQPTDHQPRIWSSEGFLYSQDHDRRTVAIDVDRPQRRWLVGPSGALLRGEELVTHGAPPRQTPRPLPLPLLWDSVRFDPFGRWIRALTVAGDQVTLDLETHEIVPQDDGTPVSIDRWLDPGGQLIFQGKPLPIQWRGFSSARWGDRLAGPGGLVWSLERGAPVSSAPVVALGLTLGSPEGFFTVDWEHGQGWYIDPETGERSASLSLPLAPEDLILAGVWHPGEILLRSALGEMLRITGNQITSIPDHPIEAPPKPRTQETPVGPLLIHGSAACREHELLWNDEGWLYALPTGTL